MMNDQNHMYQQQPERPAGRDYVSAKGRAIAAGAASGATMALLAFVMVILPPLQNGAVNFAVVETQNASGMA